MNALTQTLAPLAVGYVFDPWTFVWAGAMVVVALLGVFVIALTNRWRKRTDTLSASDQLTQYRTLYEAGNLSQEEYDRVRALLSGQLRQQLKVTRPLPEGPRLPPAPPAPPSGEPTPDP